MIHIFPPSDTELWQVWSDTEDGTKDGRCIGAAPTKALALFEANAELRGDLAEVEKAEFETA